MARTIGRYLVELMAANGIDTVFGIPGVHNLELYRGLEDSSIRHVLVRHEQGAGFAADGYARMTGKPAACFVISGPGLTNILTPVAQAYSDSVPLLVIASTPVRASLGKQWGVLHEMRDQWAVAAGVFGIARTAYSAGDVREHLRACFAALHAGRPRPAYLEIPLDILGHTTTLQAEPFESLVLKPHAHPEQIEAATRRLAMASRPIIIAGGGARHAGAELHRMVETLDCMLVTTAAGKGVLPESHASNLGTSLPYRPVQTLISDADVVLAVGTELSETDVYTGTKLALSGLLIRIDVDPAKLADQYCADVPVWGDSRTSLNAINNGLSRRRGWRSELGGAASIRTQIDATLPASTRGFADALKAIRSALPRDGVICSDMTQIAYFANYAFPVDGPAQWFHPSGYGTLGYALPAAIGAKVGSPARAVLALVGDFGLQFTANELLTAVELGQPLPIVVWNNAALGQIRDDMIGTGITPLAVVARNPDFPALAKACGAGAARVRTAHQLAQALRVAWAHPGPTLIEIIAADFA